MKNFDSLLIFAQMSRRKILSSLRSASSFLLSLFSSLIYRIVNIIVPSYDQIRTDFEAKFEQGIIRLYQTGYPAKKLVSEMLDPDNRCSGYLISEV